MKPNLSPEGGASSPGRKLTPSQIKSAPTPEQAWGINGHQNSDFPTNHREIASNNATHAGILSSQTKMPSILPKPVMGTTMPKPVSGF